LAEAAVIGTAMVGEKLMKKGKVSPEVMKLIQSRVEAQTGKKPSQREVKKALKNIDPNQDDTLTVKEVMKVLKRGNG
jgi:Ca2+-binding EF-hand superfamily protein